MMYKGFDIINKRGHIEIEKDGIFISTADNEQEAIEDIDEMVKVISLVS